MNPSPRPQIALMIGGAQKAGTSSLAAYLTSHPQLYSHSSRELTYFFVDDEYAEGWERARTRHAISDRQDRAFVAKSVDILYSPLAADRFRSEHPTARVLVVVRDPVARAFSAFHFARRQGWEPCNSLSEALRAPTDRAPRHLVARTNRDYLRRGDYASQLDTLSGVLDRRMIDVVAFEDLEAAPARLCVDIASRIGVQATTDDFDVRKAENVAAEARSRQLAHVLTAPARPKRWVREVVGDARASAIKQYLQRLNQKPIAGGGIPSDSKVAAWLREYYQESLVRLSREWGVDTERWTR